MIKHSLDQLTIQQSIFSTSPLFVPKPIFNGHEEKILDILSIALGDDYRFNPQVPLKQLCDKTDNLDSDHWQMYTYSVVDIVITKKHGFGNKLPLLAIECQSGYHDNPKSERDDAFKRTILDIAGIPLVQTREIGNDRRYYRFFNHLASDFVEYDVVTRKGLDKLTGYLRLKAHIDVELDFLVA